ncbi:hypothetical protein Dimus_012955 [Dionaea muscipula]
MVSIHHRRARGKDRHRAHPPCPGQVVEAELPISRVHEPETMKTEHGKPRHTTKIIEAELMGQARHTLGLHAKHLTKPSYILGMKGRRARKWLGLGKQPSTKTPHDTKLRPSVSSSSKNRARARGWA